MAKWPGYSRAHSSTPGRVPMEIHCMAPVTASPMQRAAAVKRHHRSQAGPAGPRFCFIANGFFIPFKIQGPRGFPRPRGLNQYASFSVRYAFSPPMGMRTWAMESRSRTVTQLSPAFSASPTVSKSTVTQ